MIKKVGEIKQVCQMSGTGSNIFQGQDKCMERKTSYHKRLFKMANVGCV
uniref:Uncharacterized protein n=1 Tax=Rhizophora mucronata TaxID=61149 RepID=A0A2P2PP04_RHIMU